MTDSERELLLMLAERYADELEAALEGRSKHDARRYTLERLRDLIFTVEHNER